MVEPATVETAPEKKHLSATECAKLLREAVEPLLLTEAERATFEARPGISFAGLEIFLNSRVESLRLVQVESAHQGKVLDEVARQLLAKLRGTALSYRLPGQVRKDDYYLDQVQREIVHSLFQCLSFLTPGERNRLLQDIYTKIKPLCKRFVGKGLDPEGEGRNARYPEADELRLLAKELIREISRGYRFQRAPKSEENAIRR